MKKRIKKIIKKYATESRVVYIYEKVGIALTILGGFFFLGIDSADSIPLLILWGIFWGSILYLGLHMVEEVMHYEEKNK